jgi:hypothetical protein
MKFFFTLFLFVCFRCFGQEDANSQVTFDSSIRFQLTSQMRTITKAQLDTGFTIQAVDTSIKLISFSIVYACNIDGHVGLQSITFQKNKIYIDKKYPRLWWEQDPKSNFITVEYILCENNNRRYFAKPLFIPIKD